MKLTVKEISDLTHAARMLKAILASEPRSAASREHHIILPAQVAEQLPKIDLTGQREIARHLRTINQVCDKLQDATITVS